MTQFWGVPPPPRDPKKDPERTQLNPPKEANATSQKLVHFALSSVRSYPWPVAFPHSNSTHLRGHKMAPPVHNHCVRSHPLTGPSVLSSIVYDPTPFGKGAPPIPPETPRGYPPSHKYGRLLWRQMAKTTAVGRRDTRAVRLRVWGGRQASHAFPRRRGHKPSANLADMHAAPDLQTLCRPKSRGAGRNRRQN